MSDTMTIEKNCNVCRKKTSVNVKESDFEDWQAGKHIQDAFPYLTPDEREIFISGICGTCWDIVMSGDDDDDDSL